MLEDAHADDKLMLEADAQKLVVYSSSKPSLLPSSATEFTEVNVTSAYFMELCRTYVAEQKVSLDLASFIHDSTTDQYNSSLWCDLWNGRLTSSMFHTIVNRRDITDPKALVTQIMGYKPLEAVPAQIKWGQTMEAVARQAYLNYMKIKVPAIQVKPSGLSILPQASYLGSSGDGWIFIEGRQTGPGVLEIKCPYSVGDISITNLPPEEITKTNPNFFLEFGDNGKLRLKRKAKHFTQIQGEMAVMNCNWCHFVVWANAMKDNLFVEEIAFDVDLWNMQILPKLNTFYENYVVP